MQEKLFTSSYSPVLLTKAVKDETEQRVLRNAHVCHLHTHTSTHQHATLAGFLHCGKLLLSCSVFQNTVYKSDKLIDHVSSCRFFTIFDACSQNV